MYLPLLFRCNNKHVSVHTRAYTYICTHIGVLTKYISVFMVTIHYEYCIVNQKERGQNPNNF